MKSYVIFPLAVLLVSLGLGPQMAFGARPVPGASLAVSVGAVRRQGSAKIHQATGEVISASADSLLLLHARGRGKQRMEFTLTPETRKEVSLAKGKRVIVFYREISGRRIAVRIRLPYRSRRSKKARS